MNQTVASYLEQGKQMEAKGDVIGAIKLYSSLLRTAPDEVQVHIQLASCYDRLGRTDDAIKYLTHVRNSPGLQPRQQYNPVTGRTEVDNQAQQLLDTALNKMRGIQSDPMQPQGGMEANVAQQPSMQQDMGAYAQGGQPGMAGQNPYGMQGGQNPGNMGGGYPPQSPAYVKPDVSTFGFPEANQQAGAPNYDPRGAGNGAYPAQGNYNGGFPPQANGQAPMAAQAPHMGQAGFAGQGQAPQAPQGQGQPGSLPGYAPQGGYPASGYESRMQTQAMAGEMTDYDPMSTRGYDPLAGYDRYAAAGQPTAGQPMGGQPVGGQPMAGHPALDPRGQQMQQTGTIPGMSPQQGMMPQAPGQRPQPGGFENAYGVGQPQGGYAPQMSQMPPQAGQPYGGMEEYSGEGTQPLPAYDPMGPEGYGDGFGNMAQEAVPPPQKGVPPALIVVLCVLLPPVGIILLFRSNAFAKSMRIVLAITAGFMTLLIGFLIYYFVTSQMDAPDPNTTSPPPVTDLPTPSPGGDAASTADPEATGTDEPGTATVGVFKLNVGEVRLVTYKLNDEDKVQPKAGNAFLNVQCKIYNESDVETNIKLDNLFTLRDLDGGKAYEPVPYHTMTGTIPVTGKHTLVGEPYFEIPIGARRFVLLVHMSNSKTPVEFPVELPEGTEPVDPKDL